jgi:hypothetical protein
VGDRPITSGYRNDARMIDTEVFQSAGADSLARATGLTLLEQGFESALAAIPSGYGEGVYEELRYGVTVRKSRDGKRTSLFARADAGPPSAASTFTWRTQVGHLPRSEKCQKPTHPLAAKHGRSKWNIVKQRAEPPCENSICIRNF